jgi:hypothetical protein
MIFYLVLIGKTFLKVAFGQKPDGGRESINCSDIRERTIPGRGKSTERRPRCTVILMNEQKV